MVFLMEKMMRLKMETKKLLKGSSGMEMVQVAILIAVAIVVGTIFRSSVKEFVSGTFDKLNSEF